MKESDETWRSNPNVLDLASERDKRAKVGLTGDRNLPASARNPSAEDLCLRTDVDGDLAAAAIADPMRRLTAEYPQSTGALSRCRHRCVPGGCFQARMGNSCANQP